MRIHQVLCAAGPVDAVTAQGLACRELFAAWGWEGDDHAAILAPGLAPGRIRPLQALRPESGDAVLLHYSGYTPGLERLVGEAPRSALISHNVTPARWFWAHAPVEAVRCALGPGQLGALARATDLAAGVSSFNAGQLREAGARHAEVIPVLFNRERLGAAGPEPDGDDPPEILFVGRLVPHKRQDLVIRAFGLYRRRHAPEARLRLVGTPLSDAFAGALRGLADEVAPGAVTFEQDLSAAELWDRYRAAAALVCLSEHEGFCIPLLEALHFGLPVLARRAGGVGEVLGDAGLLLEAEDDLPVVAELLHLAVTDAALRAELRHRAKARLEAYDHERTAALLRERLESLAS